MPETFICKRCKWYAEYEGVCLNADAKFCADNPPYTFEECDEFDHCPEDTIILNRNKKEL